MKGCTSGAMYSTVPTGEMASSCFMLMVRPKSPRRTLPSSAMNMFSSFTSLHRQGLHCYILTTAPAGGHETYEMSHSCYSKGLLCGCRSVCPQSMHQLFLQHLRGELLRI